MDEIQEKIDRAARVFRDAATALNDALLANLQYERPDMAAEVREALGAGERLHLVMQFDPENPLIIWRTVDDYEHAKLIMTVPGRLPSLN